MVLELLSVGTGPRVVAFLSPSCAKVLKLVSREVQKDLSASCEAICRPSEARNRVKLAAQAVREALRSRQMDAPRHSRPLLAAAVQMEESLSVCAVAEAENRACLGQGLIGASSTTSRVLPDGPAAAALGALLENQSVDVRRAAAVGLGHLGSAAAPYTQALATLLRDPVPEVRLVAVNALGSLGSVATQHTSSVAAALRDPCPHVCARAVVALGRLGSAAAEPSAELLGDEDRYVRARAAAALGRLGGSASSQVGAVAALLDDAHQNVRETAAEVLYRITGGKFLRHAIEGGRSVTAAPRSIEDDSQIKKRRKTL